MPYKHTYSKTQKVHQTESLLHCEKIDFLQGQRYCFLKKLNNEEKIFIINEADDKIIEIISEIDKSINSEKFSFFQIFLKKNLNLETILKSQITLLPFRAMLIMKFL